MTRSRTQFVVTSVIAALLAVGVAGCASATQPGGAGPSPSSPAGTRPATTRPAASTTIEAIPNTAILLVERPDADGWGVIEAASGGGYLGPDFVLPVGAARPGWTRIVSAAVDGDHTTVRDTVTEPGFGGPALELDGHWRLPTIGDAGLPVGVSADGSTVVLVEAAANEGAASTRFAVIADAFQGDPATARNSDLRLVRTLELPGRFTYDAMSSDGRILYVVEHLDAAAGGHYQVRAVDLPAGTLRPQVIVDKANPDEWMAGYPIAQIRRADGVVMTLYDGPEHPFILARQSNEAWALCIDLPVAPDAERSAWGLTTGSDGRTVFAANGSSGVVVELEPNEYAVKRIANISTSAAATFSLAKFGHSEVGPVGSKLVALPNGSGLLVAMPDGVAIVSPKDLQETGRVPTGAAVETIGLTPDGSLGFALTSDRRIVAFDPRSGRAMGEVPNGPFTKLLAVGPW
jgi:hypothetical protein